jgi:hypothetical protein
MNFKTALLIACALVTVQMARLIIPELAPKEPAIARAYKISQRWSSQHQHRGPAEMERLLADPKEVNARWKGAGRNQTVLMIAAPESAALTQMLLDRGTDINAREYGTALCGVPAYSGPKRPR